MMRPYFERDGILSYRVLAERFGVSPTGVRKAINGENWGSVLADDDGGVMP